MLISLILCTDNYVEEMDYFFKKLEAQTSNSYELIVIDQSNNSKIWDKLNLFSKSFNSVKYQQVGFKGLSRSRNLGLTLASGDIIGFPDDDCYYQENTVELISDFFVSNRDIDFLSVRTEDPNQIHKHLTTSLTSKATILPYNTRACSITLFFRRDVFLKIGWFDVLLGLGATTPFKAGEEEDVVLRALGHGYSGIYYPITTIAHPVKNDEFDLKHIKRKYYYSCGKTAAQIKNINVVGKGYFATRMVYQLFKPFRNVFDMKKLVFSIIESFASIFTNALYFKYFIYNSKK